MKGTDTEIQGVEMIMKSRCMEKAREWGRKKQGGRKSLTHGGYEAALWMPEEGYNDFKELLIYQFILYICVFIWVLVRCNMRAYKAEVRLSKSSCEMRSAHLECV